MTKTNIDTISGRWPNLADDRFGSKIVHCTDDFFAEASRMLSYTDPVWKEGVFDDNGKWMDGWESRRKRYEGYDHAIVKLGLPGTFEAVDIDTTHFTGNFPPSASLQACYCEEDEPGADAEWIEVLPSVSLSGNSHHLHLIADNRPWTHVKLNIYPDGGIARLRIWGRPYTQLNASSNGEPIDLASILNGGRTLSCSDEHFGRMANILNPGRGINMGDGWETARRRTPGNDWVIVALGYPGNIRQVEIDTAHFKGNYPDSCSIQAAYVKGGTDDQIETQSLFWRELLPAQKLSADAQHQFQTEIHDVGPITHVRLNIFPDGGISRLRLIGTPLQEPSSEGDS
ncbi:Allantoicase [Marinobacterium lacunae]|uniref:Probable allantoicase n=1 Tax=Marinobacterium lacunae TaxID=1232683 RepID=A0A081G394_9GAMM|nr:allantoicase [Marinobacterium lacunae]KEA65249.1 Allantoicase [Marinobacterium lacunae]